ncbi:MAG: hypothetical protein V2A56_03060 [bacterium]
MKRVLFLSAVLILALALIAGCAAGPNQMANSPGEQGSVAGFWQGLWHGFILLFTFIISLFNHNVQIYEVHNNGGWYNFGYLLGVLIFFGSSGRGASRRSRRS